MFLLYLLVCREEQVGLVQQTLKAAPGSSRSEEPMRWTPKPLKFRRGLRLWTATMCFFWRLTEFATCGTERCVRSSQTTQTWQKNNLKCKKCSLSNFFFMGAFFQGCSGDERVMAKTTSDVLFRQDKQVVMEGQEPANFWVALGGKSSYASDKR